MKIFVLINSLLTGLFIIQLHKHFHVHKNVKNFYIQIFTKTYGTVINREFAWELFGDGELYSISQNTLISCHRCSGEDEFSNHMEKTRFPFMLSVQWSSSSESSYMLSSA